MLCALVENSPGMQEKIDDRIFVKPIAHNIMLY